MLIKVFGEWINPNQIVNLAEVDNDTNIWLTDTTKITVKDKTPDEVAEEIGRQILAIEFNPDRGDNR